MKKAFEWLKEFWFLWFFFLLSYLILRISGFDIKIVKSDVDKIVIESESRVLNEDNEPLSKTKGKKIIPTTK